MNATFAQAANVTKAQLYVVFNPLTMHVMKKADRTSMISADKRTLSRLLTTAINKGKTQEGVYKLGTIEEYNELDTLVPTTNILGKPGNVVMIRKSEVGTCTDPSTERYHTM